MIGDTKSGSCLLRSWLSCRPSTFRWPCRPPSCHDLKKEASFSNNIEIAVGLVGMVEIVTIVGFVGLVGLVGMIGMMGMVGIVGFVRVVGPLDSLIDLNSHWHKHQYHAHYVLRHHEDRLHVGNYIFHLLVTLPALTQNSICKEPNT